jgi:hypothetical protein
MTFRTAFIVALRAAGVPDGLVLDALLAAEASERSRRAALRAARMNKPDSKLPVESGSSAAAAGPPAPVQSVGGPVKDRARRGLALAPELRPASRAVGAVLIERFNLGTGRCDPGVADIAAKAGLSTRSVRRALADLDERGLIVRVLHGGRRHANAYRPDWEALGRLGVWAAPKMNDADSGATRTLVAVDPDSRVRQNLQGNIKPPVRGERSKREPDRRQGVLMLPIAGRAAVAASSAEGRLWSDVQAHFRPHGTRALEAATLRLLEGGLGERAIEAEQSKRGDGLRVVLNVLREA